MKANFASPIRLAIVLILLLPGCKKDSNPVSSTSYVDGYNVTLTETQGTVHTGNFFPLQAGYACNYGGSADMLVQMTAPGYAPMVDSVVGPATGQMAVLPLRAVHLTSGTVQLYPIVDLTVTDGTPTQDTSRFFMKDSAAVSIKALKLPDGSFMEVANPIFIKTRLVVGDAWETAPQLNIAQLLAGELGSNGAQSNLKLDARAKFFVVGKEGVVLPVGLRDGIRVEQANDLTLSGTIMIDSLAYAMTISAQIATVYHLIADTGIAHQNATGHINVTVSGNGETITISIVIRKSELTIASVGHTAKVLPTFAASPSGAVSPDRATQHQRRVLDVSRALANILTRKLTL